MKIEKKSPRYKTGDSIITSNLVHLLKYEML